MSTSTFLPNNDPNLYVAELWAPDGKPDIWLSPIIGWKVNPIKHSRDEPPADCDLIPLCLDYVGDEPTFYHATTDTWQAPFDGYGQGKESLVAYLQERAEERKQRRKEQAAKVSVSR